MVEPYAVIIMCAVSFSASWVGSLAGGGGLVVLPVMLSFGLPVPIALGTRRLSTIGTITSGLVQFHRWNKIDYKFSASLVVFALTGALIGYLIVDSINELILKRVIGFTIIAMGAVLIFEHSDMIKGIKGKLFTYRHIIGPPVAILSGTFATIIGGGGGLIMTYLLIIVYGQTILESAGNRRLPLLAGNILAAGLFIMGGYVHYPLAAALFLANTLGGWFGSRFYLKKGDKKVRIFFFAVVLVLGIKILFF
ncbi:MAG: sulfite exporter TauE/SafE family protein [Desulfobacterales bacterium]|nr:sulfite exporter TauE/SafE family protein [Desulfobacterales bacterium]